MQIDRCVAWLSTSRVFVQADPIRAPARAQDLMLRHLYQRLVLMELHFTATPSVILKTRPAQRSTCNAKLR
jgi:hypothetical protein